MIAALLAAALAAAAPVTYKMPKAAARQTWAPPSVPQVLETPLPGDPMGVTIHRLKNGLTIYLSPSSHEPRISAHIAVRAGSKHDPADSTGMAHYLEHMLFKGTTKFGTLDWEKEKPHLDRITALYEKLFTLSDPAQRAQVYKDIDAENIAASKFSVPNEIAKLYRLLGIRGLNAYTSDEMTVYVLDMPKNRLEAWARLETERFSRPVFRLFQTELETVYEEKNRSMDNAERILGEAVDRAMFKAHPYGTQPTLGTIEHLKNPSLKKMLEFYDRWYRPNNMAIALSGDFDRAEALKVLESAFGAWQPHALPAVKEWPLPKPAGVEKVEVKYEAEEKVVLGWMTVALSHPDRDALTVADMIMDNSASGLINLHLNQQQLVKAAGSYPSMANDAGAWYLWALPKQGQTVEQAEALLLETVERLKRGEFSQDDIKAVITNFEIGEKAQLESNESRVNVLVSNFLRFEPWPATVQRLDRLRKVTKDDVVRVANLYLGADRVSAYRRRGKPELPSIQKPQFTKIEIDPSRESALGREILAMPAAPIEPKWVEAEKDYRVTDLREGRLYSGDNPFNDLFSIGWRFDLGKKHRRELCAALDLLDLAGAGKLGAEELKKKLYALGTSMSSSCGEQSSMVSLSGLEKNMWESLELLRARFETPVIASDTLKKMVDVAIGQHQDNKQDPGYVHHALEELAQRGPESSVLSSLTDAELRALKEERLRELLRELWQHKRRVGYVGNRPAGELARLIDDGRRDYRGTPDYKPLRYLRPSKNRVLFTHRDMVQSRVGMFAADDVLDTEKALDYQLFSSYMGGGMSAVIFQEVREARSLAYSAGGGYYAGGNKGDENVVEGFLGCQADKTVEAVSLLEKLFREPPLTEKRFRETAQAVEQSYRTNRIGFRGVPWAVIDWEDQGLSGDPRPKRFERLKTYSLEDLRAFAARTKEKAYTFYILSHRDRVGLEGLRKLGAFEEKQLSDLFPY